MAESPLNYERMVQDAMRGVVRDALQEAASHGLSGDHHFYIGFKTGAPEVELSKRLRAQYPEEMTIVLQHQYWDLMVDEVGFSVGLSFGGKREHLFVPFAALTSFVDPSVEFGLQFAERSEAKAPASDGGAKPAPTEGTASPEKPAAAEIAEVPDAGKSEGEGGDKIVSLDQFRKK